MVYFTEHTGVEARPMDPEQVQWPDNSLVVFGTEDDKIVARSGLVLIPLVEGTWVASHKRVGRLALKLMQKIEGVLRANKAPYALALQAHDQPEVSKYLTYLGYEQVPVNLWKKKLE